MIFTLTKGSLMSEETKFEIEELDTWHHALDYFLDLLNGEADLEETRENLLSFRNTKYYTGRNKEYIEIKEK